MNSYFISDNPEIFSYLYCKGFIGTSLAEVLNLRNASLWEFLLYKYLRIRLNKSVKCDGGTGP